MTSASELFYTRRSRAGRDPNSTLDSFLSLELDRDRDRVRDHHRRQYRRHLHHDDCDPSRRSHAGPNTTHARHLCPRTSQTERDSTQLDQTGGIESSISNNRSRDTGSSRTRGLRFIRNDRLPGAVLQARARLLERLRGVSRTGNRQSTAGSGVSRNEVSIDDEFRVIDSGDWETESSTDWSEFVTSFTELNGQGELSLSLQDSNKKTPALSPEALNSLLREVFRDGESNEGLRASVECCICLEQFCNGDRLIRLLCGHRYHAACLEPWVQACGDCPYCRTCIIIDD